MIALELARELKRAGLIWQPKALDTFMIPDRDLDDKTFVLTDMAVRVEMLQGFPTIMFQGAYEWALDYIWVREVVWIPSEAQLREQIAVRLRKEQQPAFRLTGTPGGYVCEIRDRGRYQTFEGKDAGTAYARTLLYLLKHRRQPVKETRQ
jgi:hypothetical protein